MKRLIPIFLTSALFSCGEQEQKTSVDYAIDHPQRDTLYSDLTQSLLELERRIIEEPQNAAIYAERATAYIAHDSIANGINDLKRAIALDSLNARYHVALGEVYFHKIRIEEAQESFRKAVDVDDNANGARLKLAEIELLLGNFQKTFDMVNEALKRNKHLARGYYIKGMAYSQVGDTALAISSYKTAVEQEKDLYDGYMQLGVLHDRLNDPLALDYFNTAIELSPNSLEAYYGKAMYLQNSGADSSALEVYSNMKEMDPSFSTAWYNSGYIYLEHLDDPDMAIKEFNQACRMQPDFGNAFFSKGIAHERKGELEKAGMSLQLALRLEPGNSMYANAMSRLVDAGYQVKPMPEQ